MDKNKKKISEESVGKILSSIEDYQELLEFHQQLIPNTNPEVFKRFWIQIYLKSGLKLDNAPKYDPEFKGEEVWNQLLKEGKIGVLDDRYYRAFFQMQPANYDMKM